VNTTIRSERGQTLVEFSLVLPLLLIMALGVIEMGYALLDQHAVTKMTREGSNLISRNTTLQDAVAAMKSMSSRSVDFDNGSKIIFSVIKRGATSGTNNYNKDILYQRYEYGTLAKQSVLATRGACAFGGAPEYAAANSDSNVNLQVTNLPITLGAPGDMVYITEIFATHTLITPFDRLGVPVPRTLYSIAYF
jgi:Flp pilus assembly protein TadG